MWAIFKYENAGDGITTESSPFRIPLQQYTKCFSKQWAENYKGRTVKGAKLDNMSSLTFYYLNRLANMVGDGSRQLVSENSDEHRSCFDTAS